MESKQEAIQDILERCAEIREQAGELIEKQKQQLKELGEETCDD